MKILIEAKVDPAMESCPVHEVEMSIEQVSFGPDWIRVTTTCSMDGETFMRDYGRSSSTHLAAHGGWSVEEKEGREVR